MGQRKESFAVNLGEIFDLVNLNPTGDPTAVPSSTDNQNITSLILEVPIDCLTGEGNGVIGGWTTSRLPRNRALSENPTFDQPDDQSGNLVQVSRLGNPLINETVIGLPDKNLFNASRPSDDQTNGFLNYIDNPTLPELLEILFGVQAALLHNSGRVTDRSQSCLNAIEFALTQACPDLASDSAPHI